MKLQQATTDDVDQIWEILQFAIASRKQDGSEQWQDGYPNLNTVKNDIEKGYGHVLKKAMKSFAIVRYCSMMNQHIQISKANG